MAGRRRGQPTRTDPLRIAARQKRAAPDSKGVIPRSVAVLLPGIGVLPGMELPQFSLKLSPDYMKVSR